MNESNYFSAENNLTYMGASQFKTFMDCEARGLAEVKGEFARETTTALLVGSYVDAYFSGTLDEFKADNPQIFKRDGTLKADYIQANEIIQAIESDPIFMEHLQGKKQEIMTGKIAGVPFKIKVDSLLADLTVDLKIMRDMPDTWKDGELVPFWKAWGYDIQAAIYQTVRAQNDGCVKPFRLAVATKEKGTDKAVYEFTSETIAEALQTVRGLAPRFDAIKKGEIEPTRCECCEYCRRTKKVKEVILI